MSGFGVYNTPQFQKQSSYGVQEYPSTPTQPQYLANHLLPGSSKRYGTPGRPSSTTMQGSSSSSPNNTTRAAGYPSLGGFNLQQTDSRKPSLNTPKDSSASKRPKINEKEHLAADPPIGGLYDSYPLQQVSDSVHSQKSLNRTQYGISASPDSPPRQVLGSSFTRSTSSTHHQGTPLNNSFYGSTHNNSMHNMSTLSGGGYNHGLNSSTYNGGSDTFFKRSLTSSHSASHLSYGGSHDPEISFRPLTADMTMRDGGDDESNCVTIFGFAPSDTSLVLADIEQCGFILRKKVEQTKNWMHVKFSSAIDAQKALRKDGRVIADRIMIGVRPCTAKDFLSFEGGEDGELSMAGGNTTMAANNSIMVSHHRPRELRARPRSVSNVSSLTTTPKKNNSYLSLAKEYIFGW